MAILRDRLRQMKTRIGNISSVLLATHDGLTLCALLQKGRDEGRLSPLCASAAEMSRRHGKIFGIGDYEYTIIKGSAGQIIVMAVPPNYLLGIHLNKRGNLPMALEAMESAAAELTAILSR